MADSQEGEAWLSGAIRTKQGMNPDMLRSSQSHLILGACGGIQYLDRKGVSTMPKKKKTEFLTEEEARELQSSSP